MRTLVFSAVLFLASSLVTGAQEESASPAADEKSYPEVPKEYEVGEDTISPDEVVKYFDRDFHRRFLKKYPKESDSYTFVNDPNMKEIEFKDHKLLLNIFADNKPNLAGGPHWTAELHGVWDLDKAKFDKVDFRPGRIEVRKWLE
jgi:hypothetical protein